MTVATTEMLRTTRQKSAWRARSERAGRSRGWASRPGTGTHTARRSATTAPTKAMRPTLARSLNTEACDGLRVGSATCLAHRLLTGWRRRRPQGEAEGMMQSPGRGGDVRARIFVSMSREVAKVVSQICLSGPLTRCCGALLVSGHRTTLAGYAEGRGGLEQAAATPSRHERRQADGVGTSAQAGASDEADAGSQRIAYAGAAA